MISDPFARTQDSPTSPAEACFAIIPDDVAELPVATKGIYIGGDGDVAIITLNNSAPVTFRNLLAGTVLDVRARAIMATGTTATDMVGLY